MLAHLCLTAPQEDLFSVHESEFHMKSFVQFTDKDQWKISRVGEDLWGEGAVRDAVSFPESLLW